MQRTRQTQAVKEKEWVVKVTQQNKMINFLLVAYAFLLVATMAIILLQGFHAWGFALEAPFLKWLGAATIGEVAGLLVITYKSVFKA